MGSLDAVFADLLDVGEPWVPPTPGESGEFGESLALARVSRGSGAGNRLANDGERMTTSHPNSPAFATPSQSPNRPESQQTRGFSPDSPDSPTPLHPQHSPECWSDREIAGFVARRDRLLRWGWPDQVAEKLAERLTLRHRDFDDRVSCTDCFHYRPGRCGNHKRAGLPVPAIGTDLASMLQRCGGFEPRIEDKQHEERFPSMVSTTGGVAK